MNHHASTLPDYVSAKEIAKRISCSERHIRNLSEKGKFKEYRFGDRCVRYDREEVTRALGIKWEGASK